MPTSEYELEELLEELEKIRGSHTELVTVYIPAEGNINIVGNQIEAEKSTASNIKSKTNRKNVVDALERIGRELKYYKKTPDNGLAIFCGNVSEKEGQSDIKLWILEPPNPLRTRLYRCDKEFVLSPLKEMLEVEEVYGLVVMDRREATLGLLEGKQIKVLRKLSSNVPGKTEKGGQCLSPETLVETEGPYIKIKDVKIGDSLASLDFKYNKVKKKWNVKKDKVLLIKTNDHEIISSLDHIFYKFPNKNESEAPVEVIAEELRVGDWLVNKFSEGLEIESIVKKNNAEELIDIEVENNSFIANEILVHNSAARFARLRENAAKEFYRRIADSMKKLYFDMPKLKGIILGGPVPTKEDFLKEGELVTKLKEMVIGLKDIGNTDESGLTDLVEASNDLLEKQEITREKKLLESFFEALGKGKKAVYHKKDVEKALQYGAVNLLILSKKLNKEEIRNLSEKANNISAKVEMVSDETEEGKQFLNLGGIGAILRFETQ